MDTEIQEVQLNTYPAYKDSGVEWLGEIPEHWEVKKIKRFFKDKGSLFIDGDWIESKDIYGKDIYYFTTGNIRELSFYDKDRTFIANETFKKLNCIEVFENDILISRLNLPLGRCCLAPKFDRKVIVSVDVCIFRPDLEFNRSFLVFLMNSSQYFIHTENEARGAIMKRISRTILGNISLPIPSPQEQTAIAQFLDDKTTKIDDAIAIKQRQIELLKERKQILIHKAVTRGLDDDVKLKDSGVEWIGEIPEHWETTKFRYLFNLGKGLTITKENLRDEGVFCVNYGEIHSKYGFELDTKIHPLKYVEEEYCLSDPKALIKEGDFVFADTSEDIEGSGNFTYLKSDNEIFAGYHTVIARPKNNIISRFFAYQFDSMAFRNQIRTQVKGVKVYSITQFILKQPTVWIPPVEEQIEIVNYLNDRTKKIDEAIGFKQQEIEKLKEYKSSLINSAVTGKIKIAN